MLTLHRVGNVYLVRCLRRSKQVQVMAMPSRNAATMWSIANTITNHHPKR